MRAKLICYSLKKMNPVKKVKFHRELYGYKDVSNFGKYSYHRKGLLDGIKHKKIFDAIIVTSEKNARLVVDVLKKYKAKHYTFGVTVRFKL